MLRNVPYSEYRPRVHGEEQEVGESVHGDDAVQPADLQQGVLPVDKGTFISTHFIMMINLICFNPFGHGRFLNPYMIFQSALSGVKLFFNFFFIRASAIKVL